MKEKNGIRIELGEESVCVYSVCMSLNVSFFRRFHSLFIAVD